jgi:outer membrane PBP1 activator LpoA protein
VNHHKLPKWAKGLATALRLLSGRSLALAGAALLTAACAMIPKSSAPATPAAPPPAPEPSATVLPADSGRHRIALLVPLGGESGAIGQAIANATTMALLDTNADNLRITTYDTSEDLARAARQAIADGNRLILGPLTGDAVPAVHALARAAGVPMIAFANDISLAAPDLFVMGVSVEQSIRRSVAYARARGSTRFAALLPEGDYGARSGVALENAVREFGGVLVRRESYARGNSAILGAAQRLRSAGGYDAVLIADTARLGIEAADELQRGARARTRIIGTELWGGESVLTRAPAMEGAIFATVSDQRFKRFAESYEARFGSKPHRLATLGYDAVLLTLRVARGWKVGTPFPRSQLYDRGGFIGVDGAFRFGRNGVVERALEVREVRGGEVVPVDPAPAAFGK